MFYLEDDKPAMKIRVRRAVANWFDCVPLLRIEATEEMPQSGANEVTDREIEQLAADDARRLAKALARCLPAVTLEKLTERLKELV